MTVPGAAGPLKGPTPRPPRSGPAEPGRPPLASRQRPVTPVEPAVRRAVLLYSPWQRCRASRARCSVRQRPQHLAPAGPGDPRKRGCPPWPRSASAGDPPHAYVRSRPLAQAKLVRCNSPFPMQNLQHYVLRAFHCLFEHKNFFCLCKIRRTM